MNLIEIGVDVYESTHPILMIRHRAQSLVRPLTSRDGDKDADVNNEALFRVIDRVGADPNLHRTVVTTFRDPHGLPMSVLNPAYLKVGVQI